MLHDWFYQGFLAFRRRCGETLQDFCCPPGACGLSQNPPPITSPLLQLQDQRSSKILQPLLQLPPLFPRSHCTGSVWLPRPILCPLLPTCRPLQSATGKVRVEVILVADYVIKKSFHSLFLSQARENTMYNTLKSLLYLSLSSHKLALLV